MKVSTPTGRCGPCCSTAATGRTAIVRLMSRVRKSSVVRSSQERGGHRPLLYHPALAAIDLDLDLELRPGEAGDDHQGRGRRRRGDVAVAHLHVGLERWARSVTKALMRTRSAKSIPASRRIAPMARKQRSACAPASSGTWSSASMPSWPEAKTQPGAGRHLDAVAVAGERRVDRGRAESAHGRTSDDLRTLA